MSELTLRIGGFYRQENGAIWACTDQDRDGGFFCDMVRARHGERPYYDRGTWFNQWGRATDFNVELVAPVEPGSWVTQ